jgi:hypothetical protein
LSTTARPSSRSGFEAQAATTSGPALRTIGFRRRAAIAFYVESDTITIVAIFLWRA